MAQVNVRLEKTCERGLAHCLTHLLVHLVEDVRSRLHLAIAQQLDLAAHLLRHWDLGALQELIDGVNHRLDHLGLALSRQTVAGQKELQSVLVDAALLLDEPIEQLHALPVAEQVGQGLGPSHVRGQGREGGGRGGGARTASRTSGCHRKGS